MASISVEVVYALPGRQDAVMLELPEGATLAEAVARSGLLARHPEAASLSAGAGIFGAVKPPETVLAAGDRVEIYRPLQADPKQARRSRAARRKSGG